MNENQLRHFVTVVEEGNISKAAKKLFMSQPPLTRQMQELETEFNATLFQRGPKQITLTEEGQIVYQMAKNMIIIYDNAKNDVTTSVEGNGGIIKIGAISSITPIFLPSIIQAFNEEYPKVKYQFREENTAVLLDYLQNDMINIAFVRTPFICPQNFERINLKSCPMYLVGTEEKMKKFQLDYVTLRDLDNQPIIIYERWSKIYKKLMQERELSANFFAITDSAFSIIGLANQGLGYGFCMQSMIPFVEKLGLKYKRINCDDIYNTVCLLYKKNEYQTRIIQIFIKFVLDYFEIEHK